VRERRNGLVLLLCDQLRWGEAAFVDPQGGKGAERAVPTCSVNDTAPRRVGTAKAPLPTLRLLQPGGLDERRAEVVCRPQDGGVLRKRLWSIAKVRGFGG
jgi:hypothetical protein